eukprot:GHVQ01014358.1.p1 GENE.GHVQ01014358.1~~GHVQ01014358.1.p1  ORF type:complete len:551 (+),score=161.25 GHVQ01014358.1:99-1655(+)
MAARGGGGEEGAAELLCDRSAGVGGSAAKDAADEEEAQADDNPDAGETEEKTDGKEGVDGLETTWRVYGCDVAAKVSKLTEGFQVDNAVAAASAKDAPTPSIAACKAVEHVDTAAAATVEAVATVVAESAAAVSGWGTTAEVRKEAHAALVGGEVYEAACEAAVSIQGMAAPAPPVENESQQRESAPHTPDKPTAADDSEEAKTEEREAVQHGRQDNSESVSKARSEEEENEDQKVDQQQQHQAQAQSQTHKEANQHNAQHKDFQDDEVDECTDISREASSSSPLDETEPIWDLSMITSLVVQTLPYLGQPPRPPSLLPSSYNSSPTDSDSFIPLPSSIPSSTPSTIYGTDGQPPKHILPDMMFHSSDPLPPFSGVARTLRTQTAVIAATSWTKTGAGAGGDKSWRSTTTTIDAPATTTTATTTTAAGEFLATDSCTGSTDSTSSCQTPTVTGSCVDNGRGNQRRSNECGGGEDGVYGHNASELHVGDVLMLCDTTSNTFCPQMEGVCTHDADFSPLE